MQSFVLGQEYNRKKLLEFVGSRQAQSGVLWGAKEAGCIICTTGGRHGKKAGYSDELLPNGAWWYFGQGVSGDQTLGNFANAKLASLRYSVLLFTTREPTAKEVAMQGGYGKLFAYRGIYNVASYETYMPHSGVRGGQKLLRFLLVPAEHGDTLASNESLVDTPSDPKSLRASLTELALDTAPVKERLVEYRKRCARVQRYARLRANGVCEACNNAAPFEDEQGRPFLEVHHLLRLADDGPDAPINVAAICPNCHRRAHYGVERSLFNRILQEKIAEKESSLYLT